MKPPKYAVRGAAAVCVLALGACASPPPSLVPGPVSAAPPLAPMFIERRSNGAIWQPQLESASLFSGERRPQAVGDTMKVDISESLKASQKRATDTSRDNKQAVKGPGNGQKDGGLFDKILNVDASAGSSDSFKGSGNTEVATEFTAQLAVSVINVLPNGHLVVAGERRIGVNGGASALRFSGVVNPQDIRLGNVVNSRDVANASLESAGSGDVSEAASRSWLQRVLAKTLSVW
ncbi:flagellar basal body L-ring protein FlgH [Rhizobacter sp. OV335]|uniref:flagellar basal body L-ring protein FlgH n=1 Tax=Rhizobacter sp. OV335 TaxID=1500264 RepID=UPI0009156AA9|nr:flagellar basal body L-ring protein FlgH [Rhizobacter sp. OV335]SHM36591.1 flagellar L-ring protein precursor FlgH [Rhizobacter sp. OV335]